MCEDTNRIWQHSVKLCWQFQCLLFKISSFFSLNENQIGDTGAAHLGECLKQNTSLQKLRSVRIYVNVYCINNHIMGTEQNSGHIRCLVISLFPGLLVMDCKVEYTYHSCKMHGAKQLIMFTYSSVNKQCTYFWFKKNHRYLLNLHLISWPHC